MNNTKPKFLMGLLSLIVPGLGQMAQRQRLRGMAILVSLATIIGLGLWKNVPLVFVAAGAIWLWAAWDAYRMAQGKPAGTTTPFLLAALAVYAVGLVATEVKPAKLATGYPALRPILNALTSPELLAYPTEDKVGYVPFQVPCVDPLPASGSPSSTDPAIVTSTPCADIDDTLTITGTGFFPNFTGELWWRGPIGDQQHLLTNDGQIQTFNADANGQFSAVIKVPLAVPINQLPGPGETDTHQIEARQHKPYGSLQPTETLSLIVDKIGETIGLAFLATVLATVLAVPVSFLAARNLMGGSLVGVAVYYVIRTILNVVRSIETLIWAIIFAVWVGLGPFAGTMALLLHSIAALGKLFSEAVESIDPGPIEAMRSTGANIFQVIVYGVIPQIVPTFMSFTLYRWDINVRMATVIGLVCDAGIGFLIIQWVRLGSYRAMATAIIAITLVVAILDYVSAILRQRIITGTSSFAPPANKLWHYAKRVALIAVFLLALGWSWSVADVDVNAIVRDVGNGWRLTRELILEPEFISSPKELRSLSTTLPVPCGSGEPTPAAVSGPRINLSTSCANVGEPLVISGHELPLNSRVYVRWILPDGGSLRVKENCCDTDAAGSLRLETRVSPLMDSARYEGQPAQVAIEWYEIIGGPQISEAVWITLDLALVTLLMALIATTLGSVVAVPISFLAARNIVGQGRVGSAVYYATRTIFNLWRSVEPMILAVIFATWVGLGPFAGILALAFNNIPNLGKLFSETIEEIDTGPVEALTSTGANRLQTILFAIVPQLVPKFLAFILYQWDINIRMSTIIGFVGGGGLGQQWRVWVQLNQYSAAAVGTWAIVAMVWTMDYVSARAREKLV